MSLTNFHRMLKPGGRLAFVCRQALHDNELDHLPLAAVGIQNANDGSPFTFADPVVVNRVLSQAGFHWIDIRAHNELVSSGNLDAMMEVLLKVVPLGKSYARPAPCA